MNFFVLSLTEPLNSLVESSFYLSYYVGLQPTEVDRLSTYEYRTYLELMNEAVRSEKEFSINLAKNFSVGNLLGGRTTR